MAKRYHKSSRGESTEMHMKDMHNDERRHNAGSEKEHEFGKTRRLDMYGGMDARRRTELEDAGMIHEDHRAIANLPQEVMIKPYPLTGPYNPEGLDDTIRGVDHQMDYDDKQRARHFFPKKV
jgi:hypothetical protein